MSDTQLIELPKIEYHEEADRVYVAKINTGFEILLCFKWVKDNQEIASQIFFFNYETKEHYAQELAKFRVYVEKWEEIKPEYDSKNLQIWEKPFRMRLIPFES